MRSLLGFISAGFLGLMIITSCGKKEGYSLKGEFDDSYNNQPVLLISLSSGDTLARDTVRNNGFLITGNAAVPDIAQVRIGGVAIGNVVLEPGDIIFTSQRAEGTPLNDALNSYNQKYGEMAGNYIAIQRDSTLNDSIKEEQLAQLSAYMGAYTDSIANANIDNPIGASLIIDEAYEMSAENLENLMEEHPSLKAYSKLNKILAQKKLAQETSPGKPYKDFEVTYNGTTTKLSELMQPGHYTLLDFWASWCGPCRREIPVIKEIKEEWGPKGLDVIGVAVWDEPANTEKAIQDLGIDWPVIINAQTIPTDIYGILAIPSIFLIGPDGIILARDVTGNDLKEAVANAMSK